MSEKKYNGWTNYETWNVALWIGNEQGSHEYWEVEQAEECYRLAIGGKANGRDEWTEEATRLLADRLKDSFEEEAQDVLERAKAGASMWSDLLGAALSEVNWWEIAGNYVESLDRDAIESDEGVGAEEGGEVEAE